MTFGKNAFLAATSAIAIMAAGPVLASQDTATSAGIQVADMSKMNDQAKIQVKADTLTGKTLMDSAGKPMGEIESVIVDGNGHIVALIVGAGGYLGIGERDVAVDWNLIDLANDGKVVKANLTKAQIENLPAYAQPAEFKEKKVYYDKNFVTQMQGGKSFKGPGKTPSGTNQ